MGNEIKESSTNQANRKNLSDRCSVNDTLSLIGKRWLMTILYEISMGNNQFSALRKSIPDVSEHILAIRVNDLYEHGLIKKQEVADTIPTQIVYIPSIKAKELLQHIDVLCQWTNVWKN